MMVQADLNDRLQRDIQVRFNICLDKPNIG